MKNKIIIATITSVAITGLMIPKLASAYHGDPNITGPNYTEERHEAINKALAENNYSAWLKQMQGRGITNRIDEKNFAKFSEAHRLALAGDSEGAAKIRAELGLGLQNGSGNGQGYSQKNGGGYGRNR